MQNFKIGITELGLISHMTKKKDGHGSRWGSTPRITMLANASSKLLLACLQFSDGEVIIQFFSMEL
jgi:hypothetical protein